TNPSFDWESTLPDDEIERLFLDGIALQPDDQMLRSVYADWCEQNAMLEKAAYLRGREIPWIELAAVTDVRWRAIVSTELTPLHAGHYPDRWSRLTPIESELYVRQCPACEKRVRYCMTDADRSNAQLLGEIVHRDRGLHR
ncbi:MAG TPA: hypothetical protein VGC41_06095, partial [Kofleriaceae bacterium]